MDQELLEKLRCPVSGAKLVCEGEYLYSTDRASRRRYRVEGGIPCMIAEEADTVDEETFDRVMQETKSKDGKVNG